MAARFLCCCAGLALASAAHAQQLQLEAGALAKVLRGFLICPH